MPPITVLLLSAHPLLLQLCTHVLENLPRRIAVMPQVLSKHLDLDPLAALATSRDVVVISLDFPAWRLAAISGLQARCSTPVLLLCSSYILPSLDDLTASGIAGIISSLASLEELTATIYALADGHPEPLLQQYLRAARTDTHQQVRGTLSEREREILQLIAEDLTDDEVALRLIISAHTVHNHLRHAYAKLGVRGRAGAVAVAVARGMVRVTTEDGS